jgi:hypothetical protein
MLDGLNFIDVSNTPGAACLTDSLIMGSRLRLIDRASDCEIFFPASGLCKNIDLFHFVAVESGVERGFNWLGIPAEILAIDAQKSRSRRSIT